MKYFKICTGILIIALSACSTSSTTSTLAMATPVPAENPAPAYLQATKSAATQAATPQTTQVSEDPESTSTASSQLQAEDWQNWPIIPEVTNTAREIYRNTLAVGNNTRAFSKVGDLQNTSDIFMGLFDDSAKYKKINENIELKDTITNFDGSFDRDGQAVNVDFTAESILTQGSGDPAYCLQDETPLECELRITRPAFVFISLEVWFADRTPESYERIMRSIIEYTISQGTVPILATKADNIEEDNSINLTTAKLALDYDIPLWNWWAAAQPLDNHGLDSYRDGFYISEEAWQERSLSALRVLDDMWKGLRGEQEGQVYTYEHDFDYLE